MLRIFFFFYELHLAAYLSQRLCNGIGKHCTKEYCNNKQNNINIDNCRYNRRKVPSQRSCLGEIRNINNSYKFAVYIKDRRIQRVIMEYTNSLFIEYLTPCLKNKFRISLWIHSGRKHKFLK